MVFPSSQRRGGAKRRGGQFGETFRRSSIKASPYRARASRHPVCAFGASTPPLRGGEYVIVILGGAGLELGPFFFDAFGTEDCNEVSVYVVIARLLFAIRCYCLGRASSWDSVPGWWPTSHNSARGAAAEGGTARGDTGSHSHGCNRRAAEVQHGVFRWLMD